MSLKSFFALMLSVIIMGAFILKYYAEYFYIILFIIFIMGLVGEYLSGKVRHKKNNSPTK